MIGIKTSKEGFGKERFSVNVARLKKGSDNFEVVINSEEAIDYKNGEIDDIRKVLDNEHIFANAKKGELASEEKMKIIFGTEDSLKIAEKIIKEGEIQLTTEYRKSLKEKKMQQVMNTISANAIDGRTNLPIPLERIKNAIEEKKIHIDEMKPVGKQVEEVVQKIRELIPIKFGKEHLKISVPATSAMKVMDLLKRKTEIVEINWLQDGRLEAYVDLNANQYNALIEEIEKITHGSADIKTI